MFPFHLGRPEFAFMGAPDGAPAPPTFDRRSSSYGSDSEDSVGRHRLDSAGFDDAELQAAIQASMRDAESEVPRRAGPSSAPVPRPVPGPAGRGGGGGGGTVSGSGSGAPPPVSTTVVPMTYVSLPKMYFTSSRAALVSLWPLSR